MPIYDKKTLNEYLSIEFQQYGKTRYTFPILKITEKQILCRHTYLLRKAEYHMNVGHKLREKIYKILLYRIQNKYHLHVPLNCCKKGLKIMHVAPVLINPRAKIGEYCSLHSNSSIVAGGRNNGVPTIGDGVVIGVGAVVLGDIQIANYIAIGANAVVNKSFLEENVAIAGVPAKKISENGRMSWKNN